VDAHDLAVMAATLAKGGVNPVSGAVAASADSVAKVLTVMTTCGMYDAAGQWFYDVGLPAKSGVGGGIIAVLPGRLGISVFSPLLDEHGNSVRGVAVCRQVAHELNLSLLRSSIDEMPPIRAVRPASGGQILAIELQGHLDFTAVERCVRAVLDASPPPRFVVLDLGHITDIYQATGRFRDSLSAIPDERGGRLVASGMGHLQGRLPNTGMMQFEHLDQALEWCESELVRG
jgi:glutaminase